MSTGRFYRSTRDAFPCERFPAIEHYRRPWPERAAGWLGILGTLALFAFIGVLASWRG
jgi:hypothetical protein